MSAIEHETVEERLDALEDGARVTGALIGGLFGATLAHSEMSEEDAAMLDGLFARAREMRERIMARE